MIYLYNCADDLSKQIVKLKEEARLNQEALRREQDSVSSFVHEAERLRLQVAQCDDERVKLTAVAESACARNLGLESCVNELRAELATLKLSYNEMQVSTSDEHRATLGRLESDIEILTAQLRTRSDEHTRQMREISISLDEERLRTNAEAARCKLMEDDLTRLQLRLDSLAVEHARELASVQENSRRLQAQMQAQCDKLQQSLSAASAMSEREVSVQVRLEQEAVASQAVVDILRKHLHDAQESVSEYLKRCSSLEAELSAVTINMERKTSENERCKQAIAACETRTQEKDQEIQRLHDKISSEHRDADARVKSMQHQWEASENRAASLQQQLHDALQTIMHEKGRRSVDELAIGNFATEVKLLTSTLANAEQQMRSKDSQILQMQEHATQLQLHLNDADAQNTLMQQRLEALKHEIETMNFRVEAERSQMQTAHSIATSGLLAEVLVLSHL